jgi:uncharacterized RDD family membrane protein YckC
MGGESAEIVAGKNCDHPADALLSVTDAPSIAEPAVDAASDNVAGKIVEPTESSSAPVDASYQQPESDSAWRDELSARLSRYRARRKMPPPRYPSLNLKFGAGDTLRQSDAPHSSLVSFEPLSDQSLALDAMASVSHAAASDELPATSSFEIQAAAVRETSQPSPHAAMGPATHSGAQSGAKIIEFPRFAWAPPPPPLDQLAEPVSTRPRILEVPEFAPPPPALGGITIEPAERQDNEKRPGIDIPLRTASLARRIFATAVDVLIISTAAAAFGLIFWKVTAIRPPQMQTLELAVAIPCLFWAVYQYLLIVYSGTTLGLRAAGLELARFDGSPTTRTLRRWRVVASFLSAASLGMGYAWVFLDEDSLCWHDRATRTHLAQKATEKK